MKILITGNMGYIGPIVVRLLSKNYPDATLIGYDMGFFAHCLTGVNIFPECHVNTQYFGDVRNIPEELLNGISSVIYLAAISNDPMGNTFESPTLQINYSSAINIARKAKKAGSASFVFASSCSMYGSASDEPRTEDDPLNPLTAYAKSKVYTEQELCKIADDNFIITSLRFSTACGMSGRLRLDLVLNDFVASAVASKKITILSDGKPWRPLIHVKDMARAIDWAVTRKRENGGNFLAVNVGSDKWNYQVRELAEAVADIIPGVSYSINQDAQPDKRSYRVNFELFKNFAPNYQPQYDLEAAVRDLWEGLELMKFNEVNFRNSSFIRLNVLRDHISKKRLDSDLKWIER
jgi:nucleoside-diphosphate-sugar epimerase